MSEETKKMLRELAEKATKVVAWYATDGSVRGPYCRWLTCTQVNPEYRKHVADIDDDVAFAAAAMNNLVPLLNEIESFQAKLTAAEERLSVAREALEETHRAMWDVTVCLANCQTSGGLVKNEWINRVLATANELERKKHAREALARMGEK